MYSGQYNVWVMDTIDADGYTATLPSLSFTKMLGCMSTGESRQLPAPRTAKVVLFPHPFLVGWRPVMRDAQAKPARAPPLKAQ